MALAPIALFVYNRPDHTRRTLAALRACPELVSSQLTVYCDGAKRAGDAAVTETRRVVRELVPTATFVEADANRGLARSIIAGTTELVQRYGRVIVVEDDLEVTPDFLRFLNSGLDRYAADDRVMQVSGYQFPVEPPLASSSLFMSFPTSWGWATWARAWAHFDPDATGYAALKADAELRRRFDLDGSYPYFEMLERQRRGEIDSWAIRWTLSVFMRGGLVLYPGRSLVQNTGFDRSGTHGGPGFAPAVGAVDSRDLPEVALDVAAQRRVFAFLAAATQRGAATRLIDLAARWTRVMLSHPMLPAPVRAFGNRMVARARAWRTR